MTAVYAATTPSWFDIIVNLDPAPAEVAFWRPSDRNARQIEAGEPWFFKEWGAPRILGLGRFVRYERTTLAAIWERFGGASGATSFADLLATISKARGERGTDANTTLGNVVLNGIVAFPSPVRLADIGLDDLNFPFEYVPPGNPILDLAVRRSTS